MSLGPISGQPAGGTIVTATSIYNTANNVFVVGKTGGATNTFVVDTRDPTTATGAHYTNATLINGGTISGLTVTPTEFAGSGIAVFGDFIFGSINSGTQTASFRASNRQVRVTGSAVCSGVSGASIRADHVAAVWNSTGACAAMSCTQINSTVATNGITAGTVTDNEAWRVATGYTGTGSGAIINNRSILIQTPSSTDGTRPITTNIGLDIQDQTATGITNAYAIRTGTGLVNFGDVVSITAAAGYLDLSAISAGNANLKITATSDTPSTTWTLGASSNPPSGFMEILVGASARYIPFFT